MPVLFPLHDSRFLLPGPVGKIELLTSMPEEPTAPITAIICHPHPLQGGSMANKVVTTLHKALQDLNIKTVRFNFRGVGQTEGMHDQGEGETNDVFAIAQWLKAVCPHDALWLAGFSFGAYVSYQAAVTCLADSVQQLISVAPPVAYPQFHSLPAPSCPWLVVQGEADEVVNPADVYTWLTSFKQAPRLLRFKDTGHFFHGQLIALREGLKKELKDK